MEGFRYLRELYVPLPGLATICTVGQWQAADDTTKVDANAVFDPPRWRPLSSGFWVQCACGDVGGGFHPCEGLSRLVIAVRMLTESAVAEALTDIRRARK